MDDAPVRRTAPGGILLTGGASSRMGRDKATLPIDGTPLAVRIAALLAPFVAFSVEVGTGVSGLEVVREEPPGEGPLVACAAGYRALLARGLDPRVPCLVVACDLPLLNASVLARLADWPGSDTVLPVLGGRAQPLCARWSAIDLGEAGRASERGERSLRKVPDRRTAVLATEAVWGADAAAFSDVDSPEDLRDLGLAVDNPTRERSP